MPHDGKVSEIAFLGVFGDMCDWEHREVIPPDAHRMGPTTLFQSQDRRQDPAPVLLTKQYGK